MCSQGRKYHWEDATNFSGGWGWGSLWPRLLSLTVSSDGDVYRRVRRRREGAFTPRVCSIACNRRRRCGGGRRMKVRWSTWRTPETCGVQMKTEITVNMFLGLFGFFLKIDVKHPRRRTVTSISVWYSTRSHRGDIWTVQVRKWWQTSSCMCHNCARDIMLDDTLREEFFCQCWSAGGELMTWQQGGGTEGQGDALRGRDGQSWNDREAKSSFFIGGGGS